MEQSDIDRILSEIREKKQPRKPDAPKENGIDRQGKKALMDFMNTPAASDASSNDDEKLDAQFPETEYVSKKSEDYLDEAFMKFFTQSVVVTKSPDKTNSLGINRRKGGLFRKKYITDSLSLNLKEEAKSSRERPAEKKPAESATAKTDAKSGETRDKKPDTATTDNSKAIEADAKPPMPDADRLARQILQSRRRAAEPSRRGEIQRPEEPEMAVLTAKPAETVQKSHKEPSRAEYVLEAKKAPEEKKEPAKTSGNSIVDNIYTAIIENRAAEEPTGYIEREEEKEETTAVAEPLSRPVPTMDDKEEEEEEDSVFEEYVSNSEFFTGSDRESDDILSELLDFRQTLSLRMILGFVCGGILTYFSLSARNNLPMPAFISPVAQPLMFFIACAAAYLIAFVGFLPTVISGFTSFGKAPAPDSFVSLGAVLSLLQIAVLIIFNKDIAPEQVTIYAGFICIALAFNALGKKTATDTIIKNLTLANVPDGINAGYIINDADAVRKLARSLDEKIPRILVSRKTGAIKDFVKAGFSVHPGDRTAEKTALASYAVTALCFLLGAIMSKDLPTGIFCAAGAAAFQIPLSSTLVSSVPDALMQKSLEKVGALVNGRQGINRLSETTHLCFDAKHLFPEGTVILHGIKTFEKERIDLAIIYAASVLVEKCRILRPVFMGVIGGKTDILYPVDSCEYTRGQGYVAWVKNNRVIVGNRVLMERYEVPMPPISIEARFVREGRKPVYLAIGGKLYGMFVFSYRPDRVVKENVDKLIDKGVNLILSSDDFNIDPSLVEQVYDIPRDCVTVMNRKESALLGQFTEYAPESEAALAHLDSLPSLVAGFCAAESAKSAERLCSMLRSASVAIGAVMAVIFTYFGTMPYLSLLSVILLGFGFMGLTMLAAFTKKY